MCTILTAAHSFTLIEILFYLVFTETLRKYPILPFLDRICCSDYELPAPTWTRTIRLPAGTGVYISVLTLQHDAAYFPEPEKFDPDRFKEENKSSRPKYTYIPFGEGPQMCIGKERQLSASCVSSTIPSQWELILYLMYGDILHLGRDTYMFILEI
jgi:hypothetical protein